MSWARKTHRNINGECVWVVVWLRDEVGGAVCRERGRRAAVGGAAVGQGRHGGGAVAATWRSLGLVHCRTVYTSCTCEERACRTAHTLSDLHTITTTTPLPPSLSSLPSLP